MKLKCLALSLAALTTMGIAMAQSGGQGGSSGSYASGSSSTTQLIPDFKCGLTAGKPTLIACIKPSAGTLCAAGISPWFYRGRQIGTISWCINT